MPSWLLRAERLGEQSREQGAVDLDHARQVEVDGPVQRRLDRRVARGRARRPRSPTRGPGTARRGRRRATGPRRARRCGRSPSVRSTRGSWGLRCASCSANCSPWCSWNAASTSKGTQPPRAASLLVAHLRPRDLRRSWHGARRPRPVRRRASLVVTLALVALAAGYGQFGATSALGDVAKAFGIARRASRRSPRVRGSSGSTLAARLRHPARRVARRAAARARSPTASGGDRVLYVCGVAGLCVTACGRAEPGVLVVRRALRARATRCCPRRASSPRS